MHDLFPGHQITSNSPASSFLVIDSGDRSTATSTSGQSLSVPITQPFNNFRLQKPQNILQGGFNYLKLTEVRFPYAMWNVITDVNDSFWATVDISGINTTAKITATGNFFYDGKALATEVAARLNSALSAAVWTVTYIQGGMVIAATGAGVNGFKLYPINPANIGVQPIDSRSLLDVLGFDPVTFWNSLTFGFPTLASNWAPLTYTSYIDFVSNNLTKYQDVADASSKTNSPGAVILRLFLNDETSTVPIKVYDNSGNVVSTDFGNAGSFPFVIHRQFKCPKVFKWNPGAAIDSIDLQLFDDKGLPFASDYIDASLPNFQITFLATEE